MPEESTPSELRGLTPEQTAKADRIFNISSRIGSGGTEMKPETTKAEMLPSMREAAAKVVEEGDADKAGAIKRNIETIKKELGIKPKG